MFSRCIHPSSVSQIKLIAMGNRKYGFCFNKTEPEFVQIVSLVVSHIVVGVNQE